MVFVVTTGIRTGENRSKGFNKHAMIAGLGLRSRVFPGLVVTLRAGVFPLEWREVSSNG